VFHVEHSSTTLLAAATSLGVRLDARQSEQLFAHLDLLERWNRTHNLVGPGSPADWLERHTLDSLTAARFLPAGKGFDVGSGAGFPGIPLAVARPDCRITLVEPREKRAAFLANAVAALGLGNAEVRREHLEASQVPGEAQFAVSRATLPLRGWLTLAASLLAPGGLVVAFIGIDPLDQARLETEASATGLINSHLESYQVGNQPVRALALLRRP
jgi:16S rRNA (guanine527-N7)-methyltransferase